MSDPNAVAAAARAENSVKYLVENHKLILTFTGLLMAGLFAFAGRGANAITWEFFAAEGCFIGAAIAIILAVSGAVTQAADGQFNANQKHMLTAFRIAVLALAVGLGFAGVLFYESRSPAGPSGTTTTGVVIEPNRVQVAPNVTLKVKIQYDTSGRITSAEIN